MKPAHTCGECGRELPAGAPHGLCPACLIGVGAAELGIRPEGRNPASERENQRTEVRSQAREIAGGRSEVRGLRLGDYEILDTIGRGGMGVVYRARQSSLGRVVALKMLPSGPFNRPEAIERFRAEASAAASLQHPNIVAIHEVGEYEGHPYFSMEYVEGKPLSQVIGSSPLSAQRAAGYVRTIAQAIHHAHEHGILHRDLKPGNVIIDLHDQPHVTDFGLARRLEGDSELTVSGQVLGSPQYMPPEQATGKRGTASRRSDVYALGAILYHALTGRPPFVGEGIAETVQQVLNSQPVSLRVLNPGVRTDLETVCLKCLEKDPAKRYATAEELAQELDRVLRGHPVQARPVGTVGRTWRWCQRNPRLAISISLAFCSLFLGTAGMGWQSRRATQMAKAEARQRLRAEEEEQRARRNEYAADMRLAQFAVDNNNRSLAIFLLNKHRPKAEPKIQAERGSVKLPTLPELKTQSAVDLRGWEWRYLWQVCQGEQSFTLAKYPRLITGLAASKNRELLAVAARGELAIWDLRNRRLLSRQWVGVQRALAFSPTTNLLALGATNGAGKPVVFLWDVDTAKAIKTFEHPARSAAFSPNGQLLATFDPFGKVRILDLTNDKAAAEFQVKPAAWSAHTGVVSFSPDGSLLAVGEDDGEVRVVDLKTRETRSMQTETRAGVLAIALSPHSEILAAGRILEGDISLWSTRSGKLLGHLTNHNEAVRALAFTPDGMHLVSAGADRTIRIWNVSDHVQTRCFRTSGEPLWSMTLLADGRTVVSGGAGGSVCFWDMDGGKLRAVHTNLAVAATWGVRTEFESVDSDIETPDPSAVRRLGLAFTPDSRSFVTMDTAGALVRWDAQSLQRAETLPEFGSNHWALALSPDGHWLVTGDLPGRITIWDWLSRRPVTHFPAKFDWMGQLDFSSSGRFLIFRVMLNNRTTVARIWRVDAWQEVIFAGAPSERLLGLDLSPDDQLLAVGCSGEPVKLSRFPSGELQSQLAQVSATGLHFSHDGKGLYTTSYDHTAALWDLATGELAGKLRGHWAAALAVDLSPDGNRLATGGEKASDAVKIWDLSTQRELLSLRGEGAWYVRITFSPDGHTLAATALSGCVDVWRAPSWEEIAAREAQQVAGE